MSTRKVWKVYQTFSPQERSKFMAWLGGEISQTRKEYQLAILFNQASETHKEPDEREMKRFFGKNGKAYPDTSYRKLCTRLNGFIYSFLAIEEFKKDKLNLKTYALKALNSRKIPEIFKQEYNKVRGDMDEIPKYAGWFKALYQIEKEYLKYQIQHERKEKKYNGEQIKEALDIWWIHEKIGDACTIANYQSIFGASYFVPFLEEGLAHIRTNEYYSEMHILHLCEHIYHLLIGENSLTVLSVDEVLERFEAIGEFPNDAIRNGLYGMLLNYSIKILNESGEKLDVKRVYKLYEWGVDHKVLFQNGYLPVGAYKNLINICLKVGDVDKAEFYLEKYKDYLPPDIRLDAYKLNHSLILFASGKFEEVIKAFQGYKFVNVFYKIQGEAIYIEALYELQDREPDELLGLIEKLRRFIYTKNLNDSYRNLYRNRLKYFRKLVLADEPEKLKKLKAEIEAEPQLNRKDWLRAKIKERLKEE